MVQRFTLSMFALLLMSTTATAQGDAAAKFKATHAEWTALDKQLDETIEKYQTAGASDRRALYDSYVGLVKKSETLLPQLFSAATAAYKAAPNQDEEVTKVLIGMIANDVQADRYGAAVKTGKMMLDNKCKQAVLHTFVGSAYYCLDNFDDAEFHLTAAHAADVLTPNARSYLSDIEEAKKAWAAEQTIRKAEANTNLPLVKLETTKGTLTVELYENEAPGAVGNFVNLVENNFYNGRTFHRVLPGFMAQGGCPRGDGTGGPGYNIYCECQQPNHRKHFRATLSMAHAGKNTGGSQFFLTFRRTAHLDGRHTVFGRVIDGLDILEELQRIDPSRPGSAKPDRIVKATVVQKRDHAYEPKKVQ